MNNLFPNYLKLFIVFIYSIFMFSSCKENSNEVIESKFNDNGTKAIVILVENSFIVPAELTYLYPIYKSSIDTLFSELFEVPYDSLANKQNLDDIIEIYGEQWQINQIKTIADKNYNKVIVLTDQTAGYRNFIDSLSYLSSHYDAVDVILNAHGSTKSILFGNESVNSSKIAYDFLNHSIHIRALYQTCCYGSSTLNDFENAGIYCCNGSVALNSVTIFSSSLFLENWCNGATYSTAVQNAFDQEILKIKSYSDRFPLEYFLLSDQKLIDSKQIVKGRFVNLLFKNISYHE